MSVNTYKHIQNLQVHGLVRVI